MQIHQTMNERLTWLDPPVEGPSFATAKLCPTCNKFAIVPEQFTHQDLEDAVGLHVRHHLAEAANTFLKEQP